MAPSHVLVPLDSSPLADDALEHALDTFECPITVVNVILPLDAPMSEGGILGADDERIDAAREHAALVIEKAERRADAADRTVDIMIETGDPADVILDVAEDRDIDQVVMGGHGGDANRIAKRLLGTVATKVVAEAPVSVTVIR
ncbi:universal stress protein [Natranaeroarchaeum aerophilus]|uniref:Universal stress protein n=1 Tax=Natranaeroarchaeum aerophilus TaxID=2917711 RepID=A0AAE3FPS5_9EURY|nr:universal stress protein [Natranaeroarchaeum aerophilus]